MALLVYPIVAVCAFVFWALIVLTAITLYLGAYVIVFLLTLVAMAVRSVWRPSAKGARQTASSAFFRPPLITERP